MLDPEAEYLFVRRDLVRMAGITAICFVAMLVALYLLA